METAAANHAYPPPTSHAARPAEAVGGGEPLGRIAVLHVEDSPLDGDLTVARLRREGLDAEVTRVDSRDAFAAALRSPKHFDLILSDYLLPDFDGMAALRLSRELRPAVPFIFVSGVLGEENAIDSLKRGATDYVLKQRMDRLGPSIRRALCEARERSERRRVEAKLRRTEDRLRFTLDAVRVGHWDLDLASRRLTHRTPLYDEIFGYAQPTVDWSYDLLLARHVHPDDRGRVDEAFRAPLAAGQDWECECRIVRGDGRTRLIWLRGAARRDDPSHLSGIVMDVTARKEAEQEREQLLRSEREARAAAEAARAEAERASRLKDDFLTTLSHELRTPLNAVLGWAQLLRRGVIPPHEYPATVEVIERNAKLQAQLVDDLLDMSRITSGKLRLEPQETELGGVVKAAVAACRPAADAKKITVVERLDGPAAPVLGDPARLQQVVWNLLSNAVKFTPAGGTVEVAVARVDGQAEVRVTDSGQGIDPAFLPHVFDRFRQADGSTARRHGGLGVGLSIVRHLAELHGGTVSVHSEGAGTGATFTVRLPLLLAAALPGEAEAARAADARADRIRRLNPPSLRGFRVLVVDDEDDTREYVRRVLEDCEAEVLTAARAADGLRQLTRHRPDLLLSDIGMPDEDGYEFIRKVRDLPTAGGGMTPAVAITAYARPEDRQRALRAGFQMHVTKPIDPARLLEVVASMLGPHTAGAGDGYAAGSGAWA